MKSIYKKKTYQFNLEISINNIPVDISNDTVICYVNKTFNADTPLITEEANLTAGASGVASFEFTPSQTDMPAGNYIIQAFWKPFGTTREFPVLDEVIKIKPVIK
jgi:hypothetical protein